MLTKKRIAKLPRNASFFLFGPRQVGKSTLIKESFKEEESFYINLLINREYRKYLAEPSLLRHEVEALEPNIKYVIIDEVQKNPALLDEVHDLIENSKYERFFCLSGSSARKLKRGQANLLGGRAWTRELFPFSFLELEQDFKLARVLRFGSLPAPYLAQDDEMASEILDSYVDTYLAEEIKAEAIVRNVAAFSRFLKLAAVESSNLINYSNIAREAETSNKTIKEYFQILDDTLIGFFLNPYHKSDRKRLVKHPKFYLFDNGVRNALLNKHLAPVEEKTYDYGILFESFIINEIHRLNKYFKTRFELSFYRTNNGAEVDLIMEKVDGKVLALEIKSSSNPSKADFSGLYSFQELVPNAELVCVANLNQKRVYGDVTVYPWREFFNCLFDL